MWARDTALLFAFISDFFVLTRAFCLVQAAAAVKAKKVAAAVAKQVAAAKKAAPKTMKQLKQRIQDRKRKGGTPTAVDKTADATDVAAIASLKAVKKQKHNDLMTINCIIVS